MMHHQQLEIQKQFGVVANRIEKVLQLIVALEARIKVLEEDAG